MENKRCLLKKGQFANVWVKILLAIVLAIALFVMITKFKACTATLG